MKFGQFYIDRFGLPLICGSLSVLLQIQENDIRVRDTTGPELTL